MTHAIKMLGVGALALALVGGCKKKDEQQKKPEPSGKTTTTPTDGKTPAKTPPPEKKEWTSEDTGKRFNACWAAFNDKDEKAFTDCYGDAGELVITDSVPPMSGKGPASLDIAKMWWTSSTDLKGKGQLVLINGANYAASYHLSGTNDGPMKGMPATNKKFSYFGSQMGSMKPDGKLDKDWHLSDQSTMMHQLGVAPNPMAPDAEEPMETTIVVAKNDDAEKANVALVNKGYELMAAKNVDELEKLVADDVSFRYVPHKNTVKGKAEWRKGFDQYMAMHESMTKDVKAVWGAGDWVVAMAETKGKLAVDVPGFKGTKGKEYTGKQIEFFEIADGKLKSHWVFENSLSFMVQIGAVDPSKMAPPAKK